MYISIHSTKVSRVPVCMYACMHACLYIQAYIRIYKNHTFRRINTHHKSVRCVSLLPECVCVRVRVCVRVHMYMCVYLYGFIFTSRMA